MTGSSAAAAVPIVPNTTLAQQTGNNTSAASTFKQQNNGNLGAGNVSKAPITSLLYSGSTTKVYAHFMPWFGSSSHMNVGYTSSDAAEIHAQVSDMLSRGISGAIIDWYGPNSSLANATTLGMRSEAESRGGQFEFAITEDVGALGSYAASVGCDVTQQLISDLTYAYQNFEVSSAYMKAGGRPLVFFFGVDSYYIDWNKVRSSVPGNPLFIFQNSSGFAHAQSNGSFSWVQIISNDPYNMNLAYIDNFYTTAASYPAHQAFATAYKGFNENLAGWNSNRIMQGQCGQTWLTTLNEIGKYYSSSKQLAQLQIVTWNDYEEGTAIETGIDNCVTLTPQVANATLTWSTTGNENGVANYRVYISVDGQNLMRLADVSTTTHSLNLNQYALDPVTYTLYVQAVGKASFQNKMSQAIFYRPGNQPPVVTLNVSANSGSAPLSVTASAFGSYDPDGSLGMTKIDFGDGTIITSSSAQHTYTLPGTYTITAAVYDNNGQYSIKTANVVANPTAFTVTVASPVIAQTYNSFQVRVVASATSMNRVTAMKIYLDGVSVYLIRDSKIDTYIKMKSGAHHVTVQAWDSTGAYSKSSVDISVRPTDVPPDAVLKVSPATGVAPLTVLACTAGSRDGDGSISGSVINFGDGATLNGPSAVHTYNSPGTFTALATVYDNGGLTDTATQQVTATAVIVGKVTVTTPLNGAVVRSPVHFVASATSSHPITAMKIYVDNVSRYSVSASKLDTYLSLARGPHSITVQAWDSTRAVFKTLLRITVQ